MTKKEKLDVMKEYLATMHIITTRLIRQDTEDRYRGPADVLHIAIPEALHMIENAMGVKKLRVIK